VLLAIPSAVLVTGGLLYFGLGPNRDLICNEQSGFEQWFYSDRLGHVDGADYTACVTPKPGAYAVAGATGLATFGLVAFITSGTSEARRDLNGTL
jgi:hypothetical protein